MRTRLILDHQAVAFVRLKNVDFHWGLPGHFRSVRSSKILASRRAAFGSITPKPASERHSYPWDGKGRAVRLRIPSHWAALSVFFAASMSPTTPHTNGLAMLVPVMDIQRFSS